MPTHALTHAFISVQQLQLSYGSAVEALAADSSDTVPEGLCPAPERRVQEDPAFSFDRLSLACRHSQALQP